LGNILVVEDDIINQKLFRNLLTNKGFKIDIIDNGFRAFDLFCNKKYDLIIMDIHLSESDGMKATELIREEEKKIGGRIPIIGVTAYTDENDIDECLKIGMDEYITKPFDRNFFYKIIRKYLKITS
jgi:CheY-like chemotaxis protein